MSQTNLTPEQQKHLAEADKLKLEAKEIQHRLGWRNTGLSWVVILKTIFSGTVAAFLLFLSYKYYIEEAIEIIESKKEIAEYRQEQLEKEKKEIQIEKDKLLEENKQIRAQLDQLRNNQIAAAGESETENTQLISNIHNLENQATKLPPVTLDKKLVSGISDNWVYLGEYRNNHWVTRYFDLPDNIELKDLENEKYTLIANSLNVRSKKYSGDVVDILKKGEVVEFSKVEKYLFTNYVWARVK